MNQQTMKRAVVIAIAGAVALGAATPAWAAPVLSSTTAVKAGAPSATSDVRYYRGRHYRNNGAAIGLGILGVAGAVAGAAAYGAYGHPGYYRQDYYGGGPYYGGGGPYYGYRGGPSNYGYDDRY
jgi:transposase